MKKSVLTLASVALTTVFLAGCGSSSSSSNSSSTAKPQSTQTVAFIFTGYSYPYFAPMAQAVQQVAKLYPSMKIKIISAHNSSSNEISEIDEEVASGVKGIILNPVNGSVTAAAQSVMNDHIPVVTIDRDVSSPSARVAFIGDKDVVLGQEQTQYALKYLESHNIPTPWHVVILQGTLGASVATDRLQGAMNALKPYVSAGKAQIVFNQSANFATNTAQQMMSEFLAKDSKVQLVICGNDAMALGAITAIQSEHLPLGKGIFVVGADAQPQSLTDVQNGTQLDTVTHAPFVEAYWAVEAMYNDLHYHTLPPSDKFPNGNIIIPMTLVTKANVSSIAGWGTPNVVPPLPYGKASAESVTP